MFWRREVSDKERFEKIMKPVRKSLASIVEQNDGKKRSSVRILLGYLQNGQITSAVSLAEHYDYPEGVIRHIQDKGQEYIAAYRTRVESIYGKNWDKLREGD